VFLGANSSGLASALALLVTAIFLAGPSWAFAPPQGKSQGSSSLREIGSLTIASFVVCPVALWPRDGRALFRHDIKG
jgi:hypothetical protein